MRTRDPRARAGGAGRRKGRAIALAITAAAALVVAGMGAATAPAAHASAAQSAAALAASANSNLLIKYDLNEDAGTTAYDSSGNNWNGTLTGGASWTQAGDNYSGVALDGSSGYINLPNGPLQNLHDVTMSINVDLNSNTGNDWLGTLGYSSSQYLGMDADARPATITTRTRAIPTRSPRPPRPSASGRT